MEYKKTIQIATGALLLLVMIMPNVLFSQVVDYPQLEIVNEGGALRIESIQGVAEPKVIAPVDSLELHNEEQIDGYIADDFEVSPNKVYSGVESHNEEETDAGVADDFEFSLDRTYSGVEFGAKAVFREREALAQNKIYIKTSGEVSVEVQSAISNLEVKAPEIFSPVFSEVTNLVVDPVVVDEKVIYHLELPIDKSVYRENEVIQPIFDLRVDQPVEFKLHDKKIIINNEQVIDYKNIVRENEVMPPIEIEVQSAITDGKIHNMSLMINNEQHKEREHVSSFFWGPDAEGTENENVRSWEMREGYNMPIYSDFKVEDKKLYLLHNEEAHNLKVLPPEVYSGVYNVVEKNPEVIVNSLELKIENDKPIYDLRVEQPAKILWIIPWKVQSKYVIDPADGNARLVDSPWYITSERIGKVILDLASLAIPGGILGGILGE